MLGYRAGKVVCACKDSAHPDKRLFEFREIKNALSDDDAGFNSAPSDGESVYLGDVLATIETSDLLRAMPGVRERFWDMFVVDAFIKNPDRNNGNWGLLMDVGRSYELAPVYDLGSSLFSKRSPSLAESRLTGDENIEQDAFGTNVSCYRLPSEDGRGRAIHPFEYLASTRNPDLDAALVRFVETVDMEAVCALIDSVPAEALGRVLLTEGVRSSRINCCSAVDWRRLPARLSADYRPGSARGPFALSCSHGLRIPDIPRFRPLGADDAR